LLFVHEQARLGQQHRAAANGDHPPRMGAARRSQSTTAVPSYSSASGNHDGIERLTRVDFMQTAIGQQV
jgi:hypothetical protein